MISLRCRRSVRTHIAAEENLLSFIRKNTSSLRSVGSVRFGQVWSGLIRSDRSIRSSLSSPGRPTRVRWVRRLGSNGVQKFSPSQSQRLRAGTSPARSLYEHVAAEKLWRTITIHRFLFLCTKSIPAQTAHASSGQRFCLPAELLLKLPQMVNVILQRVSHFLSWVMSKNHFTVSSIIHKLSKKFTQQKKVRKPENATALADSPSCLDMDWIDPDWPGPIRKAVQNDRDCFGLLYCGVIISKSVRTSWLTRGSVLHQPLTGSPAESRTFLCLCSFRTYPTTVRFFPGMSAHVHHQHVMGFEGLRFSAAINPAANEAFLVGRQVVLVYVANQLLIGGKLNFAVFPPAPSFHHIIFSWMSTVVRIYNTINGLETVSSSRTSIQSVSQKDHRVVKEERRNQKTFFSSASFK